MLSTNSAAAGATGHPYGFSLSRGRNAHFPDTGKRFHDGVTRFLSAESDGPFLRPAEVAFPPYGSVVILGRLGSNDGDENAAVQRFAPGSHHSALVSGTVGAAAGVGVFFIFVALSHLGSLQRSQRSRLAVIN